MPARKRSIEQDARKAGREIKHLLYLKLQSSKSPRPCVWVPNWRGLHNM
jgi:hypothetical protein